MRRITQTLVRRIRIKGYKRDIFNKFVLDAFHIRNCLVILFNEYKDIFYPCMSNSLINTIFADKLYNRGDQEKREQFRWELDWACWIDPRKRFICESIKNFKARYGNSNWQSILKQVLQDYKCYFSSLKEYYKHPDKFTAKPRCPRPRKLSKVNHYCVTLTKDRFRKVQNKKGSFVVVRLDDKEYWIRIGNEFPWEISSIRVVKSLDDIELQLVYTIEIVLPETDEMCYIAGIDCGVKNLFTVVSNSPLLRTFIVGGNGLKSWNQWFNKKIAKLDPKNPDDRLMLRRLHRYRVRRLNSEGHQITTKIIHALAHGKVGKIYCGQSVATLKGQCDNGQVMNQILYNIPHSYFLKMLKYKAEQLGMTVHLVDESYTSKCSALSDENIQKQAKYSGYRRKGLYKDTKLNKAWNADCNGALNIIRKHCKFVLNTLPLSQWIDRLARPVKLSYDTWLSYCTEYVTQKVSCESSPF